MDILNKITTIIESILLYKKTISIALLLCVFVFLAHKYRKQISLFCFEQKRIILLKIKIKLHNCLRFLMKLYEFNFLLPIWYIMLWVGVFIFTCINWSKFNAIEWLNPSKESILFIWLIILSLIPFCNCEILNFKFTTNNMLNNPNAKKISEKDKKHNEAIIDGLKKELEDCNTLTKGGKNV